MKQLLPTLALLASIGLASCSKNDAAIAQQPSASFEGKLVDQIRIQENLKTSNPGIYNDYNNKVYEVPAVKAKAFFRQYGNDVIMYFKDSSVSAYESNFTVKFANKQLKNMGGVYSADDITYTSSQGLGLGSASVQVSWKKPKAANIQVSYNTASNTFSGEVIDLRHEIDVYVPYYFANSTVAPDPTINRIIKEGGSERVYSLKFSNVKVN